jgi:hypothetical protein
MARLSAHGRELLRVELEKTHGDDQYITWSRTIRTYHSDGKVLEKRDVRFKPDPYHPEGERHSYGWKLYARLKKGVDPATFAREHEARLRARIANGECTWRIVIGGPKPVIISQARIIRAVESGESIGFCQECGREQDGCEPDARNYQCESCGAMAVYGAEEMLISA